MLTIKVLELIRSIFTLNEFKTAMIKKRKRNICQKCRQYYKTVLHSGNKLSDNQMVSWLSASLSICDLKLIANNSLIRKKHSLSYLRSLLVQIKGRR